jgi:hypothetical protein
LWMCRIGPARRDIGIDGLERQHLTGGRVKSRPAIAERPPRIWLIDAAAKQRPVERRELFRIGTVQHDAFQGREWLSLWWRGHATNPAGMGSPAAPTAEAVGGMTGQPPVNPRVGSRLLFKVDPGDTGNPAAEQAGLPGSLGWGCRMRISDFSFGSVRVDGVIYDHDLIIDRGMLRKRKKAASKKFRDTYGHTPLSIAEDIPWQCRRLVIGTGADGRLPVLEEVEAEARRRKVDLVVLPTADAIEVVAGKSADSNAILHLTC